MELKVTKNSIKIVYKFSYNYKDRDACNVF